MQMLLVALRLRQVKIFLKYRYQNIITGTTKAPEKKDDDKGQKL
jgi:hypothetical protein